jgi:type IV secretory pathway TraG/TraD family ATPase VirD4
MVLGTPGSGKSESVIIPFIKQFLAKGYSMMVYDFKYPTLAKLTYYHYLKNHVPGGTLEHHDFHVVNLDDISYSQRINPMDAKYIRSLADAGETAEAIVTALKKGEKGSGGGSDQFFTQSAINFLASTIYFLAKHEDGKYSTLPHLLAFIAQPYEKIFKHLFSMIELHSLLSPFYSAFQKGAFDQLEGQIGTLRVNISRLATKETFWVFSKSDFDLKISNPPSILILANSPNSQQVNNAFFASILLRIIRLVNEPGNHPCALVVDELPTLYLHKLDNLIATARSNKVAVVLGLQEVAQLQQQQGKEVAATITSLMGSILSGAVRSKETLDWLERMFGKIKQVSHGLNIDRNKTGVNINERMDLLIPASKIANQNTGEMVGVIARENQDQYGKYKSNTFKCKVNLNTQMINHEKNQYIELPRFYDFGTDMTREFFLLEKLKEVYTDIEHI